MPGLTLLSLHGNSINDSAVSLVANALRNSHGLSELMVLNMSSNLISDAGGADLLDAVNGRNMSLRVDLCQNQLSARFLSALPPSSHFDPATCRSFSAT
jgi:hypothetical protein